MKAKKGLWIVGVLFALLLSASVSAREMAHWAIVRNAGGEVIGTLEEGDEVQVLGIWKDSPARSVVYIPAWDVTGTVAAVYIYGGTDYEYENPNEYVRPRSVTGSDTQAGAEQEEEPEQDDSYDEDSYDEDSYDEDPYEEEDSYEEDSYEEDSYIEEETCDAYLQDFYKEQEAWEENYEEDTDYYNDSIWVDVDIDAQVITLNDGDYILLSAPCVTGTLGQADTPKGEFPILSKSTTTNLSGVKINGEPYSRDVQYWMVITEWGVGIHDAPWREGVFGGDIYVTDGSMGCINVEPYVAATIYDYVHEGTMVYIH